MYNQLLNESKYRCPECSKVTTMNSSGPGIISCPQCGWQGNTGEADLIRETSNIFKELLKETQVVNEEPEHISSAIASALMTILNNALQQKRSNVRIVGEPEYKFLDDFSTPGYSIPVEVDGVSEGYKIVLYFGENEVGTYLVKPNGETTSIEELL